MPNAAENKPSVPALTPDEATVLNLKIDTTIADASQKTIASYLELGALLKDMHDGEGHRALKFRTWRDYCESKHDFGLTYLALILKIGQAGITNVEGFPGLTASLLTEYARLTDYPEKLLPLMQATFAEVKGLTVRDAVSHLRSYVQANWETYKKRPKNSAVHQHRDWVARIHKEMDGMDGEDLASFTAALKTVLAELGEH